MHYRLYFMNRVSGHIEAVEHIDAPDDGIAFNECLAFRGDRAVEVWCDTRKVGRVEARDLTQEMLERRRWERALRDAQQSQQTA